MLATRKPRFAVICRNCLAKGHSKNDCPNPRHVRCRTCLNLGHIAKDCPTEVVNDQRPNGSGDFNRGGRGKRGRFGKNRDGGSTKRFRPNQSQGRGGNSSIPTRGGYQRGWRGNNRGFRGFRGNRGTRGGYQGQGYSDYQNQPQNQSQVGNNLDTKPQNTGEIKN